MPIGLVIIVVAEIAALEDRSRTTLDELRQSTKLTQSRDRA